MNRGVDGTQRDTRFLEYDKSDFSEYRLKWILKENIFKQGVTAIFTGLKGCFDWILLHRTARAG